MTDFEKLTIQTPENVELDAEIAGFGTRFISALIDYAILLIIVLIGTIPIPHSKDKPSLRERRDKRPLVRKGATIFKKEVAR